MLLASCLVLALQNGPLHADLHPGHADLFFELTDVQGLLTAYDRSPLVELVRDERMKPLREQLLFPGEISARSLLELALGQLFPTLPAELVCRDMRTISFSATAGGSGDGQAATAFHAVVDFREATQAETFKQALGNGLIGRVEERGPLDSSLAGAEQLILWKTRQRLWCATLGPRLVVGGGSARPEDAAKRVARELAGLGADQEFAGRCKTLGPAGGQVVFWFALSRSMFHLSRALQAEGAEDYAREVRVLPFDFNPFDRPCVGRMQMVGGRFVTEVLAPDAGEDGPSAFGNRPVDPAWLERVPPDSMLVYSTAIDGDVLGKRLRSVLEAGAKDTVERIEGELGFGLERAFSHLGPGFTLHMAPLSGLAIPETRLWVDCAEPDAFRSDLEAWFGALGATNPDFDASTMPYKIKREGSGERIEVPVTTVRWPAGVIERLPSSLAFAPVGHQLVFGLGSMDVKSELKQIHGGRAGLVPSSTDPFAARGFALPGDARSVLIMDWAQAFAGLVRLALGLSAIGTGLGSEEPFDATKLPPPEIFAEHFRPTFHTLRPVEGGILRRNEASFAGEAWLLAVMTPFAMAGRIAAQEEKDR